MLKTTFLLTAILIAAFSASAQKPDEVLATATGHKFTSADLSPETQDMLRRLPDGIKELRSAVLDTMLTVRAFSLEAASQGITSGRLLANVKSKVAEPDNAAIQKVYDENKASLNGATLEQVRENIIAYLKNDPQQKAFSDLAVSLRTKYKAAKGKDVNAPRLAPTDVVATIGGKSITDAEFEKFAAHELYALNADVADRVLDQIDDAVFKALAEDEAKAQGIDSTTLIGREITDKMKDYSDEETARLNREFGERLTKKYNVKILYKAPEPPIENVASPDSPSQGPATAPVTVVMFSDFQCSACSATHPILKEAMAAYPGKIRFVVRNFPLESVHDNSLLAARAAAAANAQGKFFEYVDVLYKDQSALDAASLRKYAVDLGLNAAQFDIDFKSDKLLAGIMKDISDGEAIDITGTPTIFVNGRRVEQLSADAFKDAIDDALKK